MRQPARVHKPFYKLKLRANFSLGKRLFEKTSFCTARQLKIVWELNAPEGKHASVAPNPVRFKFVAPWTVVRSDEFVNKKAGIIAALSKGDAARNALNAAVLKEYNGSCPPYTAEELAKTPYVGYDCDRQTTCDENRPRVEQPNSDNKTSGPVS